MVLNSKTRASKKHLQGPVKDPKAVTKPRAHLLDPGGGVVSPNEHPGLPMLCPVLAEQDLAACLKHALRLLGLGSAAGSTASCAGRLRLLCAYCWRIYGNRTLWPGHQGRAAITRQLPLSSFAARCSCSFQPSAVTNHPPNGAAIVHALAYWEGLAWNVTTPN